MNADRIIVRLGELNLKGRNRHRFEQRVREQLQRLLKPYAAIRMSSEFGRIYLELNGEPYAPVAQCLDKIFGLNSYSPVYTLPLDAERIRDQALALMKQMDPQPRTFKVSVHRANKQFQYDSIELARYVGSHILTNMDGLSVDVHHPQVEMRIDIRSNFAYVFHTVIPGTGGFPYGSNGKAMLMISGGIDSPVAGWLAMRRGLEIEAVHFHSYPYTSEKAKEKVTELTRILSQYAPSVHLHMVPFADIQTKLKGVAQENLLITHMRRIMLQMTEQLAYRRMAKAIVTGESLGQVASQTLSSMNAIGQVASLPLIRPLITMDKAEITKLAEKIDTMPVSILPYEDCCTLFVPKKPTTNPNPRVVERMEKAMEWLPEAMSQALDQTEMIRITWDEKKTDEDLF